MRERRSSIASLAGSAAALVVAAAAALVFEPVAIVGGSMRPALLPGDVAIVRRGAVAHVGDVVLIERTGRSSVVHRVRARVRSGYVTRGDANPVNDREAILARAVRGVVVARVPVGRVLEWWHASSDTRYTHGSTE